MSSLPNSTLCYVTITREKHDNAKILKLKYTKDNIRYVVDEKPENYLFTNQINEQPSHQRPFVIDLPFASTPVEIMRPPIPLANSGTDCYINSIVNALLNLDFVKQLINTPGHINELLIRELKRLSRSRIAIDNVNRIRQWISQYNRDFRAGQQDCSLLLQALIEHCAPMQPGFWNQLVTVDVCPSCHKETLKQQVKSDLLLDVYQSSFKEMVIDACKQKNEKIKKRCENPVCANIPGNGEKDQGLEHSRTETVFLESNVLVFKAKIFIHYGHGNDYQVHKINAKLRPDTIIKMPDQDDFYKLKAIVTHKGQGPNVGHYITDIITSANHLLRCDDDRILKDKPLSDYGYLFIYEKLNVANQPRVKFQLQTFEEEAEVVSENDSLDNQEGNKLIILYFHVTLF